MADGYIGVKKLQQRTVSEDIAEKKVSQLV